MWKNLIFLFLIDFCNSGRQMKKYWINCMYFQSVADVLAGRFIRDELIHRFAFSLGAAVCF